MNKAEYMTTIETNSTAAKTLSADLRKLRGIKKFAEGIAIENLVAVNLLNKAITDKEAELKSIKREIKKARRILKKLAEIETIEAGGEKPKSKKATAKKPTADNSTAKKSASDKSAASKPKVAPPNTPKNSGDKEKSMGVA